MDYLAYAYLQTAQDGKVKEIVNALFGMNKVDAKYLRSRLRLRGDPRPYALERRQWTEAAALKYIRGLSPGRTSPTLRQ